MKFNIRTNYTLMIPPEIWKDCEDCGGEGGGEKHITVYERGCGFSHDDSMWVTCDTCHGEGGFLCEAEGDQCPTG